MRFHFLTGRQCADKCRVASNDLCERFEERSWGRRDVDPYRKFDGVTATGKEGPPHSLVVVGYRRMSLLVLRCWSVGWEKSAERAIGISPGKLDTLDMRLPFRMRDKCSLPICGFAESHTESARQASQDVCREDCEKRLQNKLRVSHRNANNLWTRWNGAFGSNRSVIGLWTRATQCTKCLK